ncbi:hypothetical protein SASPL_111394 [Salvia splendens]|uniref:Aquaporin TIP n=1 Tax=Salvia splendens TaxID=180675 RepID=A0A8X9A544_SALSN|nr:hypothetical protein SASPL_111394 [Salvia splendens]
MRDPSVSEYSLLKSLSSWRSLRELINRGCATGVRELQLLLLDLPFYLLFHCSLVSSSDESLVREMVSTTAEDTGIILSSTEIQTLIGESRKPVSFWLPSQSDSSCSWFTWQPSPSPELVSSLGAAIIFNRDHAWDDYWIFWVGPFIGAALAALYHQVIIRAIPFKTGH